jgi:hypothetical protein
VEEFVRLWIDSGVQPKLLAIDSDHGFVERNVIGLAPSAGCRLAFCIQS